MTRAQLTSALEYHLARIEHMSHDRFVVCDCQRRMGAALGRLADSGHDGPIPSISELETELHNAQESDSNAT